MRNSSNLDRVMDVLFTPLPVLPKVSFIPAPGSHAQRRSRKYQKASVSRAPQTVTVKGRISLGKETAFSVDGRDILIDRNTWIFGEVKLGMYATAQGLLDGGILYAKKISIE